jgi:lipid-A-disaccharide synthase-like uncharacterized protein
MRRAPDAGTFLYAALMLIGMLVVGTLIFRGGGAPREPARAIVPGEHRVYLEKAGRYVVVVEQVVACQPIAGRAARLPQVELGLTGPRGYAITLKPAGKECWLFKFLTRQKGYTKGTFEAIQGGEYRINTSLVDAVGLAGDSRVVLAFVPLLAPGRFFWLLLGFGGQICFSLRFIIQWLASEKAGRSTMPRAFWYYSMVGGLMILAYAVYTRDPVFILAYAFNSFIYLRNLILLQRETGPAPIGEAT